MDTPSPNFQKDINSLLRQERANKYQYDYNNCLLRQQIMRKEYDNSHVAQSCFGRKIDSKLYYL